MGNDEATSNKRKGKKKAPKCKNGFLETRTASLPRQRAKDLTSRPFILGKAAIQEQKR